MLASFLPILLPLGAAMAGAGGAGLIGLLMGRNAGGARIAGMGIGLGLATGWLVKRGWPIGAFSALDWAVLMTLAAAPMGVLMDFLSPRRSVQTLGLGAWLVCLAGLLVVASETGALSLSPLWLHRSWVLPVIAGLMALGWVIVLLRLDRHRGTSALGTLLAFAAALTLAAVAWVIDAWMACHLSLSLAAALVGWLIWNTLGGFPFAATAVITTAAGLGALGGAMALQTPAALPGVLMALLCLLADGTAARLPLPGGRPGKVLRPIATWILALIPLPAAVALTLVAAGMPAG